MYKEAPGFRPCPRGDSIQFRSVRRSLVLVREPAVLVVTVAAAGVTGGRSGGGTLSRRVCVMSDETQAVQSSL